MNSTDREPAIDITTLAWETATRPRDTLPFDPEVDITEADWSAIIEEFRWKKSGVLNPNPNRHDLYWTASLAQAVVLLSPQRVALLGLDDIPEETIKEYLGNSTTDRFVRGNSARVSPIKISFQKSLDQLGITDDAWSAMLERLNFHRRTKDGESFLGQAYGMAILDPSRMNQLGLDKKIQEESLALVTLSKTQREWFKFASCASEHKILFPQDASTLDAELDRNTWQELKAHSNNYRGIAHTLSKYFISLAILAARQVKITESGLELVFDRSQPFTQEIPPIPLIRKF